MGDTALESVLRRDRFIILGALAGIALLAWVYLVRFAAGPGMKGMAAEGMHADAMAAVFAPWSAADFLAMFAMWAVMMVGMMIPSAAPMVLLYARVGRQAESCGQPFAATGWFASGYLLAWIAFAVLATLLQWGLEQAALLTPMMQSASRLLGGALLIGAGLYQWTPIKDACLAQCQSPFKFIQRHGGFRAEAGGSVRIGALHGLYCIGCCWTLMLLLFVGGVMNLLWIAAIAALVLIEKVVPQGRLIGRLGGLIFMLAGLGIAAGIL